MLEQRQIAIIRELLPGNAVTIRQLSLYCGVPYKTVQLDILEVNKYFRKNGLHAEIVSKAHIGALLQCEDHARLEEHVALSAPESADTESSELQIAFAVLNAADYTKVDSLCEQFALTKTPLSNLLKKIRTELSRYNVDIETRPHYGMFVRGEEAQIRKYLLDALMYQEEGQRKAILSTYLPLLNGSIVDEVGIATLRKFNFLINDSQMAEWLLRVKVVLMRVSSGRYIEIPEHDTTLLSGKEYLIAKKILESIPACIASGNVECEAEYLAGQLIGKRDVDAELFRSASAAGEKNVDPVLQRVFDGIEERFSFSFHQDLELYTSLLLHIIPLISRARYQAFSNNPILKEIKIFYPLAYEMAIEMAQILSEELGLNLNEHETSYFAVYLHLAVERQKQKVRRSRVLVVCPSGKAMSKLLAHNIESKFNDCIAEVETCDLYAIDNIAIETFDYVFTPVPLDLELPIPVIYVPWNLSQEEIQRLRQKMSDSKYEQLTLLEMSPPQLFFGTIEARDMGETLQTMVRLIGEKLPLPDDFLAQVLERENRFPTELDNMAAFPHPLQSEVSRSFLAIAVLKKPILWNRKPVQIIYLGSIRKGDSRRLQSFYDRFSRLVSNKEYTVRLIERPEYGTLKTIFQELN